MYYYNHYTFHGGCSFRVAVEYYQNRRGARKKLQATEYILILIDSVSTQYMLQFMPAALTRSVLYTYCTIRCYTMLILIFQTIEL